MKKHFLQKQRGIVLALLCFLCVTSINAQTLLYENDFESTDGLLGSTIVGNGVFETDAVHGQVFHNNPTNTGDVRTNFLKLPETIFSDFQATGSQGLTVSFWVNKSNATNYYWSPMFGAYATAPGVRVWDNKPAFTLMARSNGLVNFDYVNTIDNQNYGSNEFTSGNSTSWLDAGGWHFYTFTITPTTGIVYVDGIVKNQWTFTSGVDGLFHVASELKYVALGGYQAWGWGDRDPAFAYDKLKIYAGAVSAVQIGSLITTDGLGTAPEIIASTSSIAFEGTTSASFTVTGLNLTDAVTLTAPLGITLSTYSIPTNPTDSTVTVTYDGTTTVDGNIVLSDGTTTANVAVKSYDSNCFTPLYPTGNIITDSRCNFYLANGWGTKSINTDPAYVYCGYSSGHTTNGSIDRALNGTNGNALFLGNTSYRVKAMVYGISGNVGVGVYGWGGGSDIGHPTSANGAWETIDFTFTTGASPNGGIFFNNGEGYIDNWEMYVVLADQLATQADKDALNARITTATNLLSSTPEGDALGQYTTANRTILQNLINSSTTLYDNPNALVVEVPNASLALVSAMLTYQSSMNKATNQLANGDYFIKIGGMYVNDPGSSSIADGTSPKISNNGLQSQISITNGSQIYTIARVSGSDHTTQIDRYSFFNAETSRNLNESALIKNDWGGTGDDPWRTQNIYYNGTNYAIRSGGNAANNGMWYLRTGNELATNGINRTPIAADYVFELVPVSTVFSQQVAAGRTAFNAATIGVAVGEYNAARYNAFQSALVTAEGITAGTATKDSLYAYGAALQLFVANANLINVNESSIAAMATIVGSTDSTTITVSAKGLSGAITLALSGTDSTLFSVSSDSLPLTADSVASTVITIKYSSTVVSLSHVATLTISSIGAADKVFALTGSSYIQADTWTAPALTGSAPASGTTYYMYNVGSNGYLTRGSNYGTQANVSAQPRLNASTSVIKWTATNTDGSMWSFQYNLDGADLADWFLCYTSTSGGDVFVDAWDVELRRPNRPWTVAVTDEPNKIYSIQVRSDYGGYNATQFLGSSTGTEDTNQGTCNVVRSNRDASDYTKWKFVSQDDLDLYNARVLLDKYMTYAKYKAMDASAYIATYNAGVTADINTAAATLLTALGRTDVTASITNPSFETAELTGWTNDGSFGNLSDIPTRGWTKDSTNYCGKSTTNWDVAPGSITQTVSGLSSGLYELVVSGYAVQNNGGNPLRLGAYITAGSQSTRVAAGQDYSISNIIVLDSTLTIGYSLVAPVKCNWTGFDNFRLYYYGPAVAIIPSKTQFSFNGGDEYVSDSLTVSGSNLSDVISITAPAGITVNPTSLPAGSENAKVVVTFENSTTVSGNITFTSGTTTVNVAVTAAPGEVCFTPLYPTGNLITDSRCNFYLANGWGGKSINTDPAYVYCGSSSAYINGGSIDRALNGTNGNAQMLASTAYRIKAKVWKVSGNVGIGVWGWSSGQGDIYHAVTTTGSWQDVDFTFTSGATLGGNQGIFFNSGVGYIDNWEMYQISPVINVVESSIAAMATTVGTTDSTTITVSGNGLSGAITLALSGTDADLFSVSSASLPLNSDSVVSTVVTIKYSPTVVSLSHVATLTISSIGATDKVFALTGSSSAVSIEKNATTNWNALVVNGKLKVIGVDSYDVYSVHGIKVARVTANSSSKTVALNQGVYVVKTDQGVQKVIVR